MTTSTTRSRSARLSAVFDLARRWLGNANAAVPGPALVSPPERAWRSTALDVGAIVLLVSVVLIIVYDLTPSALRIPFAYSGDGFFYGANAKNIIETGWVQETERLGAPYGQALYDFPIGGDNGNYLVMRVLAVGIGDWALLTNLFFLLTFYSSALVGYFALRWLACGRLAAVVCGVLFGLAPFNFARLYHMMLAHRAVIPIAVVLALRAASGASFVDRERRLSWIGWLLACVAVGSFGAYWAVFGVITIVMASAISGLAHRTIRPLLHGIGLVGVIAITSVVNQIGALMYHLRNGSNTAVGRRLPLEIDLYGLRLIQMLSPIPGGRLPLLGGLSNELNQGYQSEPTQFLGVVGAMCLLCMIAWFVVAGFRRVPSGIVGSTAMLAALTVLWVLVATTGGLNWLTTAIGFNRIRSWNRASVVIMFCVLGWAAQYFPHKLAAMTVRRGWEYKPAASAAALGVLLIGSIDQSSGSYIFDARTNEAEYRSDQEFFAEVESHLPESSNVFMLPIRRFPEELPTGGSADYDLFRGFLTTDSLRFSYGGMKGRESEWQQRLIGLEGRELVTAIAATDFEAIVIDRFGYPDRAAALESVLSAVLDEQPRVSANERFSYYSLIDWARDEVAPEQLAAAHRELIDEPILTMPDCWPLDGSIDERETWCGPSGAFRVVSLTPSDGDVVEFSVVAPGGSGALVVTSADATSRYEIGESPVRVQLSTTGDQYFDATFEADVYGFASPGDSRDLRFIVSEVRTR